jgi:hypothetical protein
MGGRDNQSVCYCMSLGKRAVGVKRTTTKKTPEDGFKY